MKNLILISILVLFMSSCNKENNPDNPQWLEELIIEIQNDEFYVGSKIYRHQYENEFYYHLEIPLSSCAFCNLYEFNGDQVIWSHEELEDYLKSREKEKIVWRNKW